MTNPLVGRRLKAFRKEHALGQDEIANAIGVNDRQTVSAIESGIRPLKGKEVAALVQQYGLDPEYLTDPFRLVGEGAFNWRHTHSAPEALKNYQERAGRWLAAYRALSTSETRPGPAERRSLRLAENSTFEMAEAEAERLTVDYRMGSVPAARLPEVMEQEFGILVLNVDMDARISGAACRLPEMDAVLVNRNENAGRRNFDLAHEFFHILTWDRMPPKTFEEATESGGSRVEKLANVFASSLLMPRRLMALHGDWRRLGDAERAVRMREIADMFQVSVTALHWRLVQLKMLPRNAVMLDVPAVSSGRFDDNPAPFSGPFLRTMADAIGRGRISVARLATLLATPRYELRSLFDAHGIDAPVTV